MLTQPFFFKRIILPGLAFKAVVIGGGYATGRELAEFFLPSGPRGGLAGMLLAMFIWSMVCALTFLFAWTFAAHDYRTFFQHLLGPFGFMFELAYFLFIALILAVFGAAAGAIGAALFGWPPLAGTLCLMIGIALVTAFGSSSVEQLFKWVSIFLYATYFVFVVLAMTRFSGRIQASFADRPSVDGWARGGLAYAGYNIIGAVVILPVVRHMRSKRDAVAAGLLAGPLAILPAVVFFICMCAFYPQIGTEALPSDFLLRQMNLPVFHLVFQLMIFAALLESGTGSVHAINERIGAAYGTGRDAISSKSTLTKSARLAIATGVLIGSIFLAQHFGLVALIAKGYRALSVVILLIYVLPLATYGTWRLWRTRRAIGIT